MITVVSIFIPLPPKKKSASDFRKHVLSRRLIDLRARRSFELLGFFDEGNEINEFVDGALQSQRTTWDAPFRSLKGVYP